MKQAKKSTQKKKNVVAGYEPTKVTLLVAIVAAVSLLLFAYLGTLGSV